jgi:hypothetical protein
MRRESRIVRQISALVFLALAGIGILILVRVQGGEDLGTQSVGSIGLSRETVWQGIRPSLQGSAWFDRSNWDAGIPDSSTNVIVHSGRFNGRYDIEVPPPVGADTAVALNLTVSSGGLVTFEGESTPGVLIVRGEWTVQDDGRFDLGNGTLLLRGDVMLSERAKCDGGSGRLVFSGKSWESGSVSSFQPGTSALVFEGSGDQTLSGEVACYDLSIQTESTVRITGRVAVLHEMKIAEGSRVIVEAGASLVVTGSIDNGGELSGTGAISVAGGGQSQIAASVHAPEALSLQPNYPNPFNPSTVIQFTVGQKDRALVRVFDIQGREIRVIFDEEAEPGRTYRVTFDATGLASGTYVYVLQSGGQQKAGRMVYQK